MTNHIPELETCQKLKEAGFPQDTLFSRWSNITLHNGNPDFADLVNLSEGGGWDWDYELVCAAPILTELLEQLPRSIEVDGVWGYYLRIEPIMGTSQWRFNYSHMKPIETIHDNPAEAAALLWLALKSEKGGI